MAGPTKAKKEPAPKTAVYTIKAKKETTKKALATKKVPKNAVSEAAAPLPVVVPAIKASA
jgi:hypothetical protein